ncbi:reverse transcriptase domain-containing protein [Tanacetum coccineum]
MSVRLADQSFQYPVGIAEICSLSIDVIDEILEEDFNALLNEGGKILYSIEGTILEEKRFAEFDEFMAITIITSLEEPPTDLELKPLPDNLEYAFLEEPSFLPVIISFQLSKNKNKLISVLKRHKQAFAWKTTDIPEICSPWVSPIHCIPKKGGITIVANEKDELVPTRTVTEGIVLGHKVSGASLEVDKAKIDVISKLPPPTNIKGIRSFLGHAGFYRRFIKDFSKIARPLTKLHEKDTPFEFNDECHKAFTSLKEKLTCTLVIVSPNWNLPFKLMCDASDFAVGAVLEFDIEIKDKKGTENVAADHLSLIENDETSDDSDVNNNFPGETLMEITTNDTS